MTVCGRWQRISKSVRYALEGLAKLANSRGDEVSTETR
jgi:hypothetical protein